MTINVFGGGNTGGPAFPVQRSVRLRSSASAYFNRTPASAGNRKTWTWSAWVKRGALGTLRTLFGINVVQNDSQAQAIFFGSDDKIYVTPWTNNNFISNAVFRDPSAWYHIVVAFDSTNATANNRVIVYVNGVNQSGTYPLAITLNADYGINQAGQHRIGDWPASGFSTFDGYLTEINFVDGQALTPSSFGSINSTTGVWQPIKYSGTYGTNGFYLNFNDNSAATAAAIGKDSSGNGNNWTPNNISVTAGVTYDSMLDVPTLTSADNANYATLNPLPNISSPAPTYTNANLTGSVTGSASTYSQIIGTQSVSSGKWYVEITATSANRLVIGFSQPNGLSTTVGGGSSGVNYVAYRSDTGNKYINAALTAYGATFTTNDIIGIALDLDNLQCTFYKNNVSQGLITGLTAGEYTINARSGDSTAVAATFNANFGQRPFSYTPPSGFKSLNTYNLPAPTIPNGAAYMAATTYTGNASTQSITNTVNSVSFQPDLAWIKVRSIAGQHVLTDSIRGVNKQLFSSLTNAEQTSSGGITSFNSNGFGLGSGVSPTGSTNENSQTYVAWQWKAGGTAVTNTSGSITSSVSANPSAGFSIVTYTGNGSAGATVGHGLGIAPKMIILKNRSNATGYSWPVMHASLPSNGNVFLNLTQAYQTTYTTGGIANPANLSTFGFTTTSTLEQVNANTNTYVAYCFSEIAGYSKFGSYTGNGSTDGPFVYLGFRPRFILIKTSNDTYNWVIYDTSRETYNVMSNILLPNSSGAEQTNSLWNFDVLSNGFKCRGANGNINGSGNTYIYACFAENPFNYSLAR